MTVAIPESARSGGRSHQPLFRFCPACGGTQVEWLSAKEMRCRGCRFTFFLNAAAAVCVVIEAAGKILLAVRGSDPERGRLDLPGGFLEPGEDAEQGLRREVREELRLELPSLRLLGTHPNTYPWGGITYATLDLIFHTMLPAIPEVVPGDDVRAVEWHDLDGFDRELLAFPSGRALLGRFLAERALQGPGSTV